MKFASVVSLVGLVLLTTVPGNLGAAASTTPPGNSPTTTNQAPALAPVEIPQSIFVIPSNPKEGRNPFFPNSTFGVPLPPQVKPSIIPVDINSFVLNGITSPPKRTAMINGRTFEVGEEGEVRLPSGGKELIKCEDIGPDWAIISSKGQRRELRFHSSP